MFDLYAGSIRTWPELRKKFLERYFLASRAVNIRKEISGIRQGNGETLYEYWERFKQLCASCPQHQISDQLLIQYFYEGLNLTERNMVYAASGGAFMNKTLNDGKQLIINMAENAQQFTTQHDVTRKVAAVDATDQRLDALTILVQQLAQTQLQNTTNDVGLFTNSGQQPILGTSEQHAEQANAVGGFQPRRNDPYSNTYNPG